LDNDLTNYANKGKQNNSGNGSLMRLAPIPVAFSKDLKTAMDMSGKSSLITHNGLEAQECCRLLAAIIVALINRGDDQIQTKGEGKKEKSENHPKWKQVIDKVCAEFESDIKSVTHLAKSEQEP
jgi:ADP-ribosylglycohydrolase